MDPPDHSKPKSLLLGWTSVILAALMPVVAGEVIGILGDPYSFEKSALESSVIWMAWSLAKAAPVGFAIWLAWRLPFCENRWRKLAIYGVLLAPASLLTSTIVDQVSLFVHHHHLGFLEPGLPYPIHETILAKTMPDVLFFLTLVLVLSTARHVVRIGDSIRRPVRLSIQSMLAFTLIVSLLCFGINHEWHSNRQELARLNLTHGMITWMDLLDILTPLSSAIATGITVVLLTFVRFKNRSRSLGLIVVVICLLHAPPVLQRQAFHWIEFGPRSSSILPHWGNVIEALTTLIVCFGCLWGIRRVGLRMDHRWTQPELAR